MKYFIRNINEYKAVEMSEELWFNAAKFGNIRLIKKYLEDGFDINTRSKFGDNVLEIACESSQLELIKELLTYPELNVNNQNKFNNTSLIWSCKEEHVHIVKELLKRSDIDVNLKNQWNFSALGFAYQYHNQELIDLLKEAGAKE